MNPLCVCVCVCVHCTASVERFNKKSIFDGTEILKAALYPKNCVSRRDLLGKKKWLPTVTDRSRHTKYVASFW